MHFVSFGSSFNAHIVDVKKEFRNKVKLSSIV